MRCYNDTLFPTLSLRYMGPLETTTPSASIYSGSGEYFMGGVERTFTGLAANNFGFLPKFLVLTGRSSWTGFPNEDFSGNATCFSVMDIIGYINISSYGIKSLVQGCNAE